MAPACVWNAESRLEGRKASDSSGSETSRQNARTQFDILQVCSCLLKNVFGVRTILLTSRCHNKRSAASWFKFARKIVPKLIKRIVLLAIFRTSLDILKESNALLRITDVHNCAQSKNEL